VLTCVRSARWQNTFVDALLNQVYDKDIAFRDQGEPDISKGWKPVLSTDSMNGLVHDGGTWKVFAAIARPGHDLNLSTAFKQPWVCLGYRSETAPAARPRKRLC
jgi:ribonuclease Z